MIQAYVETVGEETQVDFQVNATPEVYATEIIHLTQTLMEDLKKLDEKLHTAVILYITEHHEVLGFSGKPKVKN